MWKIADFFKMQRIIFMFDLTNSDIPDEFNNLFILNVSIHSLKHAPHKYSLFQRQKLQSLELTR